MVTSCRHPVNEPLSCQKSSLAALLGSVVVAVRVVMSVHSRIKPILIETFSLYLPVHSSYELQISRRDYKMTRILLSLSGCQVRLRTVFVFIKISHASPRLHQSSNPLNCRMS